MKHRSSESRDLAVKAEKEIQSIQSKNAKFRAALTNIAMTCNIELFDVESLPREQLTDDAQILFDIQVIADEALK